MLLEFKCANHKSIKEQVVFSMLAGTDDTYEETLMDVEKFRVSRAAVIYGPNGSGKSTLINALGFVQMAVRDCLDYYKRNKPFPQFPHKLSKKGTPSEYDLQFVINAVRYAYGFSVKENKIATEYLYYFPKGRKTTVFERKGMVIKPGDRYKNRFTNVIKEVLREERLFLTCAANFTKVKEVEAAFGFLRPDLLEYTSSGLFVFTGDFMSAFDTVAYLGVDLTAILLQGNKSLQKQFVGMMQALGVKIKGMKIKDRDKPKMRGMPPEESLFDDSFRKSNMEVMLAYDQFETDVAEEESRGVKRLFQLIYPILKAQQAGAVMVFDEMESSLHERLLFEIVKLFQKSTKHNGAQLIFTTHNTNLLDSDLFRRDQVWFTELNEERATDLYSLVEIRNVRKSENLAKGYISGKYGAIPMLSGNIIGGND